MRGPWSTELCEWEIVVEFEQGQLVYCNRSSKGRDTALLRRLGLPRIVFVELRESGVPTVIWIERC